jgi:hypothetical protein
MCWVTGVEGSTGHFAELTLAECEKLLAEHKAGRVGLNAPAGPQDKSTEVVYESLDDQRVVGREDGHRVILRRTAKFKRRRDHHDDRQTPQY